MTAFIQEPAKNKQPIIISIPHVGIDFPQSIQHQYNPIHIKRPRDTDWHVDKLYWFAKQLELPS